MLDIPFFYSFINLKQNIMCLDLEKGKLGRLKAKEDIICYKYLSIMPKLKEEYIKASPTSKSLASLILPS